MEWRDAFRPALEAARQENKAIMVAVGMDGEPASAELLAHHYKDPRIVELSESLICLYASKFEHRGGGQTCPLLGSISCAAHMQIERDFRRIVLGTGEEGGEMFAPNHIFLDPEGKVMFSVPYQIPVGQLEWCMVEAIRKVTPEFQWKLNSSSRAPRRLIYGGVATPDNPAGLPGGGEGEAEGEAGGGGRGRRTAEPLTEDELEAVLDALKKSGGRGGRGGGAGGEGGQSWREHLPALLVTDDERAMEAVKSWISSRWSVNNGGTARTLHEIGRTSPASFWEVVEPFVSHYDLSIRNEAVVALEQLAEPKALKALQKQRSSEKEDAVKGNLIRAIASTGRGTRAAESLVLKAAEKDAKDFMRIHGLIGLVYVEDRDAVNAVLLKALSDKNPGIRAASAYAIAVRREAELRDALDIAVEMEQDAKCKSYLQAAVSALRGGSLKFIEGVLKEYALDDIPRDRE